MPYILVISNEQGQGGPAKMNHQKKIKALLEETGIPAKEIQVYGQQIMVTTWSEDAARKFAALVGNFARVRRVWESLDDNLENRGTSLLPTRHKVWRMAAVM